MENSDLEEIGKQILKLADIQVNGNRDWDIQVHDKRLFKRVLQEGSLGLGESYMDGWWDCKKLDVFFYKLLSSKLDVKARKYLGLKSKAKIGWNYLAGKTINMQSRLRSKQVAEEHYNLGNEFYSNMLDKQFMQYTCGYWKNAKTLDDAQRNKLDLVCKKLHLPKKEEKKAREKLIEFGSGFGGFSYFAAKNYNCEVLSYNISKEQVNFGKELNKGLPVEILESDYRNAMTPKNKAKFNKVASIGMCEHVGTKNYPDFMKIADYCLKDKGLFLLHTIGRSNSSTEATDEPWTRKYIFPGGHLPSPAQLTKAAEPYFRLEDVQNFGYDYDKTLMEWHHNFEKNWPKFKDQYGERFYRMWRYYLLSCAGAFRCGNICLFQFVFSKGDIKNTYQGVR